MQMAGICGGLTLLFLLVAAISGSHGIGRTLHLWLCLAGLYVVFRAPMLTAGALSEERGNQTLGLLFLTGLTSGEVFASKFLSSALVAFTELLAIFPMLALPFLLGGVSFDWFLATVCGLPVLMLFAIAVSLLASVLTSDDGGAQVLALVLAGCIAGLGPVIYMGQTHYSPGTQPSLWWLRSSPGYGAYLVKRGLAQPTVGEFWNCVAFTLLWSAACLAGAAGFLKRLWRHHQEDLGAGTWAQRYREWTQGSREYRKRLSAHWLVRNPFVWLGARDRREVTLAWAVVVGVVLVWLGCWAAWPARWPSVPNFYLTAVLLNLTIGWLVRYSAAKSVGGPRLDGSYELLLTTPLAPQEIVRGELEALRILFQPVLRTVLCLEVIMIAAGLLVRTWNQSALIEYSIVWLCLLLLTWAQGWRWRRVLPVMWTGLNCGRPALAVWRTSGLHSWAWVWVLFNARSLTSGVPNFPSGSLGELVLVCFFGTVFLVLMLLRVFVGDDWDANRRERRLIYEFREIVREPVPHPHDPRFKKWDVKERFPWGWGLVQYQLHERLARER
jgi:ABC-type transport system involved in multi-copper enzyme maturation permease subunit